jgi:hypothetical protein
MSLCMYSKPVNMISLGKTTTGTVQVEIISYEIDFLTLSYSLSRCCGSMTFWGGSGSGSADPCL